MALSKSQKSLKSWTKEDWGTKSGKNSTQGKKATGERYLPKKAREALSDEEYNRSSAKKRAAARKGHPDIAIGNVLGSNGKIPLVLSILMPLIILTIINFISIIKLNEK